MSWEAFEEDKAFVTEELRKGEFDHLDVVGAVAESDFFRRLLGEGVLGRLAAAYPTPRHKEEVPLWLYLASELTLRLHGAMGFGAYPYVVHCGGLLDALRPERTEAKLDPATGEWRTAVEGFNHKNEYTRTTPCDKDFLRKLARQTRPAALEHWFGTSVVREYARRGAFDPAGLFAADGTYLFVPLDNDRYEDSSVLRFDEHNHPVDKADEEKMPPERRKRLRWRRCYRAITLSHLAPAGDYSLRCGTTVLPGKAAECPAVRPLVERFVGAVGSGVMKLLLFDRGLLFPAHGMAVRPEAQPGGALVAVVVERDEEIRAVHGKEAGRVEGPERLILAHDGRAEPVLECRRRRVAGQLAQEVLVARGGPGVEVLAVEPADRRAPARRRLVGLVLDAVGVEGVEQAAAVDDVGIGPEAHGAVEPQRQLARQVEPERDFLLLARRGVRRRQPPEDPVAEEPAEEVRLAHLPHHLDVIELPAAERLHDERLVLLEGFPTHRVGPPFLGRAARPGAPAARRA